MPLQRGNLSSVPESEMRKRKPDRPAAAEVTVDVVVAESGDEVSEAVG